MSRNVVCRTSVYEKPENKMWYHGTLTGIKDGEGTYGPMFFWNFSLFDGDRPDAALTAKAMTGTVPDKKNVFGKLVAAFLNKSFDSLINEELDIDEFIGDSCEVFVEIKEQGDRTFANITDARICGKLQEPPTNRGTTKPKTKPAPEPNVKEEAPEIDDEEDIPF